MAEKRKEWEDGTVRELWEEGEWHSVFCEYLDSIGRLSDYTTSIGLTLKLLSEDERSGWFNWKWEYAEKKVQKFIDSLQGG